MTFKSAFIVKLLISSFICVSLLGCTKKELYESIQPKYDEAECRKLPQYEYEECINTQAKSYEDYRKEREDIINDKS
jgi:hypothetical protein